MSSQETSSSLPAVNHSPAITSPLKSPKAWPTTPAILSTVFPIRDKLSSREQSAGLRTSEEGAATSVIMPLSNVVSFDINGSKNALERGISSTNHPHGKHQSLMNNFDENDNDEDDERIIKGRERNREHARKTRLRKKAQLQELEQKYRTMLSERLTLNQKLQDRNIASILLGLSSSAPPALTTVVSPSGSNEPSTNLCVATIKDEKVDMADADVQMSTRRKRGFPEVQLPTNIAQLTVNINGTPTVISAKSHINWKTGMYCDEMGRQSQMTPQQLEDLRRERNRMHAKMTRDRKKCFISTMEKAIEELERELVSLRCCLLLGQSNIPQDSTTDTVLVTPELTSRPSPIYTSVPSDCPYDTTSNSTDSSTMLFSQNRQHQEHDDDEERPTKRRHGFSLDE